MAHQMLRSNDLRNSSIDPLGRDVVPLRSRAYGLDDISGFAARSEPALGGLTAGMSARGYASSLEDPILFSQRRDVPLGISPVPPGNPDIIYERPNSQRRVESLSLHETESNILFVDGLPTDCTRREVGRILSMLAVKISLFALVFVMVTIFWRIFIELLYIGLLRP